MRDIIFDIEVFPKWWCIIYSIMPDTKKYIITSETDNKIQKIKDLTRENCLIGFNIKGYDLRILNAIINDFEASRIYELSKAIIENQEHIFNNYSYWFKFIFCDLYDDWKHGTLKEFESNMGMSVKECTISFNKEELSDIDKEEIIEYCQHDVDATIKLYQYRQEYIDSKKVLSELCGIDLPTALRSTNAKLSAIVLKAKAFNRPMDYKFSIPEKVKWYVEKSLPEDVVSLFDTISEDQKECDLFDNKVIFGIGGIHSTYSDNILCRSDKDYALMNIDATSYYPNLIMKFNYMSRNCINPKLYEDIYNLRVTLKNEMNTEYSLNGKSEKYFKLKKEQNALKLILNTTYGAMKNKYNALYDENRASCVCYLGQLLLASLANNLHNIGDVKIIQTNTDGLLVKYKKDKLDKINKIVQEWVFVTDISMEYNEISMFFQKDVNNYIEIDIDKKIKLKGKWANQADEDNELVANLNAPITHKAIVEYYINNTPLIETIMTSDNLLDFCFTTKTGYTYDKTYHYIKDRPILVKKINRVVATKDKSYGTLKKYKKENGKERYDKISELPANCYLMNGDLDFYSDLDRMWYVNFANDKIKELKEV